MDPYQNINEENIYTWPNAHFPFSRLFEDANCRIFLIENIPHNYTWLKSCAKNIRDTDFFFAPLGWHLSSHLANQSRYILDHLGLNKNNFFILYNSPEEEKNGAAFGLRGTIINHNAWLDDDFLEPRDLEKKYNALYIARATDFKRHHLASQIPRLALAAGGHTHDDLSFDLPPAINDPSIRLSKDEICNIINESYCGLSLSHEEGACYSSSEYLLCGIPVISTPSKGGRDAWYNEGNSIICDDTPEGVAEAVKDCLSRKWDPQGIRDTHIAQANYYRYKFIRELQKVLDEYTDENLYASQIFKKNFKWYCNGTPGTTPHIEEVKSYFQ
jgi:glycosyltransferase involved in cell wall biosynthesis